MTVASRRLKAILVMLALVLGSVGHHHAGEILSRGTVLFSPDHPAHAPFVPGPERPCIACALGALSAPAAVPYFLVPPLVVSVVEVRSDRLVSAPEPLDLSGRSPPPSPA